MISCEKQGVSASRWMVSVILSALVLSSFAVRKAGNASAQEGSPPQTIDSVTGKVSATPPSGDEKPAFGERPRFREKGKATIDWRRRLAYGRAAARRLVAQRIKLKNRKATSFRNSREAVRFAARLKRKQGRQFAKRRRDFHQQQLRVENQRRAYRQKKARARAREFAAARRHAALQAPRLHWKPAIRHKTRMRRR